MIRGRPMGASDGPTALWTLATGILTVVAIVALMGCTPTQTTLGAASLCSTAGDSLKVLAAARTAGRLTPAQVRTVLDAEILINPVCTASTPPTDAVKAASDLASGLLYLSVVQKDLK